MSLETLVTLIVAIIGAVTGTISLAIQAVQHFRDRADIKLSGSMSISSNIADPVDRYEFRLDVVNQGRRVARIAQVYVEPSGEIVTGRFVIFDSKDCEPVSLEEGDTKRFGDRIRTDSLDGMFESFGSSAFFVLRLTTGEIYRAKFNTVKKSLLRKLGRR